jgi:PAS domain-containing protein
MEREYARLRHAETRYRLLFQIASQPVLIVDANSLKVVEANPAAGKLLNKPIKRLAGRALAELFNAEGAKAVQAQLAQVRAAGRAEDLIARLNEGGQETVVGSSMFRQDSSSHFLVRLSPLQADVAQPKSGSKLIRVVENLPDGFVVTDLDRRIITANAAFIDLAELTSEERKRREGLIADRPPGRPRYTDRQSSRARLRPPFQHDCARRVRGERRGRNLRGLGLDRGASLLRVHDQEYRRTQARAAAASARAPALVEQLRGSWVA